MRSVHKQDQILICVTVIRKCIKGYKNLSFFLQYEKNRRSFYCLDSDSELLRKLPFMNYNICERPSNIDMDFCLQARHWTFCQMSQSIKYGNNYMVGQTIRVPQHLLTFC